MQAEGSFLKSLVFTVKPHIHAHSGWSDGKSCAKGKRYSRCDSEKTASIKLQLPVTYAEVWVIFKKEITVCDNVS